MARPAMTKDELTAHLREGVGETCLVCGNRLIGYWTDLNGELKCDTCGTPYQIISCKMSDESLAVYGLNKSEVAKRYCSDAPMLNLCRDYWEAKHDIIPFGMWLGDTPPDIRLAAKRFYTWLAAGAETYRPLYPDSFNWDVMIERLAKNN